MKQTVIQVGFKHTGIYKSRPTFWCIIVSHTTIMVLTATAGFLAFLNSCRLPQEYLRNVFKPMMYIFKKAFKQMYLGNTNYILTRLTQESIQSFYTMNICQTKMQPLQGLRLNGSLIPGLCHFTIEYYFVSVKAAYEVFFPLLPCTVVDIRWWFYITLSLGEKGLTWRVNSALSH